MKSNKPQHICFIYFRGPHDYPDYVILTTRLKEEEEKDVERHLRTALATLPFPTGTEFEVKFIPYLPAIDILERAVLKDIVDYPGAPKVTLVLQAKCVVRYFLPRDPRSGKFIKIEDQIKCLSFMTPDNILKEYADWFKNKKLELGIK